MSDSPLVPQPPEPHNAGTNGRETEALHPEIVNGTPPHGNTSYREGIDASWAGQVDGVRMDTGAITALVLAICSYIFLPFIGSLVAVVLAPGAKRRIRHSNGTLDGAGFAKAAQILGWLNIILCIAFAWLIFRVVGWAFDVVNG